MNVQGTFTASSQCTVNITGKSCVKGGERVLGAILKGLYHCLGVWW